MNLISKALGRNVDGPHPTAIAVKLDLIDNLLFTFNCVSCLDYPWVNECTFINPTPKTTYISKESFEKIPRDDDDRSYFGYRDYDVVIHSDGTLGRKIGDDSFSCWDAVPDGYIHSHHRLFELDGSTKSENQASLKIIIEISQNFESFSEEDIEVLKMQTKSLIIDHNNINEGDIRSLTVNRPFVEDRDRFKSVGMYYAVQRSYKDWEMINSMKGVYTSGCFPYNNSYRDDNYTHIELVFNPSFGKMSELFCGMGKWFVYNISTGPLVGKIDYNYQSNCEIACLGIHNETGTDYARRYLEYTKNSCIWGLLDCDCSSSGCHCLKVQNEGENRRWFGFENDSEKIVKAYLCNNLEAIMTK
jgi:hypothetical protein